jgi:hypothetical protein
MRDTDTLLVDERPDGTYVLVEGTNTPTRWQKSNEALHSCLCATGWKRIGKQQGSQIGGMYWLPGSEQLPVLLADHFSNEALSDDEELSFFDHEEPVDEETWLPFNDDPSDLGFDPYAGQYLDEE